MAMNNNIPAWWAHPTQSAAVEEKEHMFEKPLTPSDVGKLNRLVIPKQHAEKYFPLGGGSNSSGVDSGVLLTFEDESAKCWQFRYSYWNSSQSYVLTKGWSRYVKEKGLDAGDVVMFGRLKADGDRMFIGCRRRMAAAESGSHGSGGWIPSSNSVGYPAHGSYPAPSTHPYQTHCLHAAGPGLASQTTPSNGNSKILIRLFGVDVECNANNDDVAEQMSQSGPSVQSENETHYQPYYTSGHNAYPQSYMEYNLSGDGNQMGYHQG